jgi:predicted O-methyltransferase YrrM
VIGCGVLTWVDDSTCVTAAGTAFLTLGDEGSFARSLVRVAGIDSTPERFVLMKSRQDLDRYVGLIAELTPERIVELGIFRGGSTALLMELAEPERLLAIEYESEPVEALETYLARKGLGDTCRTEYGMDQADRERLVRLLDRTFGTAPLDLVIDDASHFGPETRASFEILFPRLRPGGVYVIEDWSWHIQGLDLPGESMAELVSELIAAAGRGPGLIASMEIVWDVLIVRRGGAVVDANSFAVADWNERMV